MDCHKLIYKPYRSGGLYDKYIEKLKEKQIKEKKEAFYQKILKFKSTRYPRQFIEILQNQVDPFEYSLESLKKKMNGLFPEYTEEVINESVEYIYNKKFDQGVMIKESPTIIEEGQQYIRNGRKLMKEQFKYQFTDKPKLDESSLFVTERNRSKYIIEPPASLKNYPKPTTNYRPGGDTSRKNRSGSMNSPSVTDRERPSAKRNLSNHTRNDVFNDILSQQIKKQNIKFQPIETIHEDHPQDIIALQRNEEFKKYGYTDRSVRDQSFPNFRDQDVIMQPEGFVTGRSDIEELNHMLEEISMIPDDKEGMTSRSAQYSMRINKQNYEKLYDAKGNLKIDLVRKAVNRMKNNEY